MTLGFGFDEEPAPTAGELRELALAPWELDAATAPTVGTDTMVEAEVEGERERYWGAGVSKYRSTLRMRGR